MTKESKWTAKGILLVTSFFEHVSKIIKITAQGSEKYSKSDPKCPWKRL